MRRPVILTLLLAVTAGIQAQVNPHTIDSLCNVLSIETDRIDDIDARHLTRIAVIKDAMSGTPRETKGKIILATVKGDIHDIGKNIVKVMLENYGYQIIDLGKDVAPETIVDTAIREQVKLVGLSALMTTTVVSMEETIRLLREKKPDTRVMVGGAVMTQEYADKIGADAYAKDAMGAVRYADTLDLR